MRALELQEYAKEHGFDSVRFRFTTPFGKKFEGKFLDAYFGMVEIPKIGKGFVMIETLIKAMGMVQEYEVIKDK